MNQAFYTIEEVAALLRVSRMTLYRHIKSGKLSAHKIGKDFRISQQDLDKYLASMKVKKEGI